MAIDEEYGDNGRLLHDYARYEERILAAQVKELYSLAPMGFVATLFNSIIAFFVMREVTPYTILLPWLFTVLTITALRFALVLWYRKAKVETSAAGIWAKRFLISLGFVGFAWGGIGFFPFSGLSLAHDVFIAFVLGGMAAGASSTFCMLRSGYAAFSIPALLPLIVHFFFSGDTFHWAMAAMTFLYALLLWRISQHNYRVHRASLLLRFENVDMIERLRGSKERVEALNRQLSAEIQARLLAEAELRSHHEQLEKVVQERTADLRALNKELKLFAYVASHDLQEPLRMVNSYLQLLKKKYQGRLDDKADTYITYAVDGGARMQKLIEGLLSYSRLSGGAEFSAVDANGVYDAAVANLAKTISESKAEVTRDELPTVVGDELQLQQLMQNLISNALKFRNRDKRPEVHVSSTRKDTEWVFSVRDNGIGIEPGYFEKIFQIFQRLHTREEYPGTGIGLASCKKIVERHGGQIWIESTPGQGSVFFFTIPIH